MKRRRTYDLSEYYRIHSKIYRRLSRVAFNSYYHCRLCGSHDRLEIHIPDISRFDLGRPGSWQILCHHHHVQVKKH